MALVSNIQLQPGAVGPPQISTNLKYTVAGLTATDALAVGVVPVSTSGSITVKSANDVRNWFQTTKSDGNVEIYMSNDARPDWALRVAGTADNSFVIANSYGSNCTAQFPAFSIGGAGAVGIGKTGATNTLDIAYKNPASGGIQITETQNNVGIKAIAESASGSIGTSSNHKLGFRVNNTTVAAFNTSTQFGIGTDSPGATLDVRGGAIFNEAGAAVDFRIEGDAEPNLFFVDGSADTVGVGTSTPEVRLDVTRANDSTAYAGTSDQRGRQGITSRNSCETANAFSGINLITGAGNQSDWSINNIWQSNYVGELAFKTRTGASSWKEIMRLTKDAVVICGALTSAGGTGDLGVGVSDPVGVLDIQACSLDAAASPGTLACYGLVIRNSSSTNAGNGIAFANDDGTVVGGSIIHIDKGSAQTGDLAFLTRDTSGNVDEALRITNAQNVGIGTASPGDRLDVRGGAIAVYGQNTTHAACTLKIGHEGAGVSQIRAYGVDASTMGIIDFVVTASDGTPSCCVMTATSTGLGIGTTTPEVKLDVLRANDATAYGATADQRAKQIITARMQCEAAGAFSGISLITGGGNQSVWELNNVWRSNYIGDLAFKARDGASSFKEIMRLTADDGNVGIGTATPAKPLDVSKAGGADYVAHFLNSTAGTSYGVHIDEPGSATVDYPLLYVGSASAPRFRVFTGAVTTNLTDDGLGIGTNAPSGLGASSVNIFAGSSAASDLTLEANNGGNFAVFFQGATTNFPTSIYSCGGFQFATACDKNASAFTEHMRICANGHVGIGTAAPGESLTVIGGSGSTSTLNITGGSANDNATLASDYSMFYQIDANNTVGSRKYEWRVGGNGYSCGTHLMTLLSTGNLGIGTTTPVQQLEINGGGCAATIAFKSTTSTANYMLIRKCGSQLEFVDTNNDGTTDREIVMVVDGCGSSSGKVGIGTAAPSSRLDIAGTGGGCPSGAVPAGGVFIRVTDTNTVGDGAVLRLQSTCGAKENAATLSAVNVSGNNGDLAFNMYNGGSDHPERMRLTAAGNFGIGTSPSYPLHVARPNGGTCQLLNLQSCTNSSEGNRVQLAFSSQVALDSQTRINAAINSRTHSVTSSHYGDLEFLTMNAASLTQKMVIKNDGKVGISTCAPQTFSSSNAVLAVGNTSGANTELVLASASSGGSVGQISFTCTANTTNQARIYYNQATGDMGVEAADDIYVTGKICKVNNPAFMLRPGGNALNRTGDGTVFCLNGTCVQFDRGSNTSSGIFTAPIAGIYHFQSNIYMEGIESNHCFVYHNLTTTGTTRFAHGLVQKAACIKAGNGPLSFSNSWIIDMAANDVARITVQVGGGSCVVDFICSTNYLNTFAGYLVG